MSRFILSALLVLSFANLYATDTLFFRLSNPYNTIKDAKGPYVRKAVVTDSGLLGLDYNYRGILVVRGYYTDSNFNHKLYCHHYFDEKEGYRSEIRCYENGKLNGIRAGFNAKGDTVWQNIMVDNAIAGSKEFSSPVGIPNISDTIVMVKKNATFPGGGHGWINFLTRNFRYPKEARKQKIEGTVVVQFIVEPDGTVTNPKVLRPAHPLLDEEAIRIIQSSPKWIPATQNGKGVRYYTRQPIIFRL